MIKVRQGVFETNSSSTHSIIIAREGTKTYDEVNFKIGQYGWEHELYSTPDEKGSYFYTAACAIYDRDVRDDICDLLSPYGIICHFTEKPLFVSYKSSNGGYFYYLHNGYVDHANEAKDFVDALLGDASLLIDFLFNDESYVETGNDNSEDGRTTETPPKCEYVEFYKGN